MKDIPGYEGLYAVTEDGQIWSYYTQKFLTPVKHHNGYYFISLYKDQQSTIYAIHRLIALTYIPNPKNLPQVDHIDRNPTNNCIDNLRWVTVAENNANRDPQKVKESTRKNGIKGGEKTKQLYSKQVEMRDKNDHSVLLKTFPSTRQAALEVFHDKEKNSHISKCARGESKSAYGYYWCYI